MADWLTPDVVDAVCAHMNDDHAEDCAVICRAVGGVPEATGAVMTGMDATTLHFVATGPTGEVDVRVPFSAPLTERVQIRAEVARLYHESAAALGLPAREH